MMRTRFPTDKKLLAVAVAALSVTQGSLADTGAQARTEPDKQEKVLEHILVYGQQGMTNTATRLDLTLFETPQTVTAISRVQMDDFALNTVNEVLEYTPGVTVEEVETNRTYYTARGFDIVNFLYDGIGAPFTYGINLGSQDTATYESVEVVKGAAGLITGLANPSATINFKRKRPTDDLQMSTRALANEWDGYRVDGDVSGSLTDNVRGRLVLATEDTDSYLDRFEDHTDVAYGVVEADLTDSTLFTLGHSYDKNTADGVLWGALPLVYVDGTATDYDVSTSNAPDWTYADMTQNQTFAELEQKLGERWAFNAQYTYTDTKYESELFYTYGDLNRDETGLNGQATGYDSKQRQDVYDAFVTGSFALAGRDHQLVFGYNYADIKNTEASFSDSVNGYPVLGADWAQGNTPRPNLVEGDPVNSASDVDQTQKSLYAASRLNLTDSLAALVGARRAEVDQDGFSYGAPADTDANDTVPYYGLTYLITDTLMAYGSYSEVFTQQTFVNANFEPLGATEGNSAEVGVKMSFNDERAVLTLATFQSEHSNLGEFIGRDEETGTALYEARDFESEGYELELTGQLMANLNLSAGFTHVDLDDKNGGEIRPYIPENQAKLSTSYRIPALPALRVGGILKWQDDTTDAAGIAEQDAYTLLDLAVHYDVTRNVSLAVNVANVTDEKYYNSLYWDQAYYGAPRNVQAAVTWVY